MPRTARMESASGYYHVMLRGNERRAIFLDDNDRKKYLELLSKHVAYGTITVLAYCLMDNYLHLLVHDETKTLSKAMRSIGISYTAYFNKKNNRVGHLFQDRFRSEAIKNEAYLFSVLRYLHQNPIKAKILTKAEEYP